MGGHRLSPRLPWYRGAIDAEMEIENQALCKVVREQLLPRQFSMAIDCHSGFGLVDRVWFPHAHSEHPIPHLADILRLEELFQETHPHHRYLFEPQSLQYKTHGDIWDYLYLHHQELAAANTSISSSNTLKTTHTPNTFLPLTLEMGSWLWVKKNPRQLFSRHGMFNPTAEHRLHRVLRRHASWLDFLVRASCGYQNWLSTGPQRCRLQERAVARWYR